MTTYNILSCAKNKNEEMDKTNKTNGDERGNAISKYCCYD